MPEAVHSDKPTLPPIQCLLPPGLKTDRKPSYFYANSHAQHRMPSPAHKPVTLQRSQLSRGHQSSRSVSSLPSELQRLSLCSSTCKHDATLEPSLDSSFPPRSQTDYRSTDSTKRMNSMDHIDRTDRANPTGALGMHTKLPSWIGNEHYPVLPNPCSMVFTPPPATLPLSPSLAFRSPRYRKPPGASHGRSLSECTLPPPNNCVQPPPLPLSLQLQHVTTPIHTKVAHQQYSHRRAASTNTMDMMRPTHSTLHVHISSSLPHRARSNSDSCRGQRLAFSSLAPQLDHRQEGGIQVQRDASGRYPCLYCNKAFSRPSSLLIHTYSHTGEKPFVCPEGCGRRFNVQSNMRRHLRVHRASRSSVTHT